MKATKSNHEEQTISAAESNLLDQIDLGVSAKREGIAIGRIHGVEGDGQVQVEWPGSEGIHPALSTIPLTADQVGRQVALGFVQGSGQRPLVLGLIQQQSEQPVVQVDGERLVIQGRREVELRCGKASILLREDGKVIVKGTHLVSRSSGANKIKGASVAIN